MTVKPGRGGPRPGSGRPPKQVSLSLAELEGAGLRIAQHKYDPADNAWYVNGDGPYPDAAAAALAGVAKLARIAKELSEELNRN